LTTRFGVSSRPSRFGSSPAQASSVLTAASASAWLGRSMFGPRPINGLFGRIF